MRKLLATILAAALITTSLTGATANAATSQTDSASQTVSPFTGKTYTHSSAFNNYNIYNGIDVSYHQGAIDFSKVKADGVEYVFLRAGYRGTSLGTLITDPRFKEYIVDASAAGLKIGLYFYTEAVNATEAKEEAKYCIELAKDYNISLPIAYDIEFANGANSRMVKKGLNKGTASTKKTLTNNCKTFCDTIKAAGYTPMIYASRSFLGTYIDGASLEKSYKIWMANYTTQVPTTYTGKYEYWQYSSDGKVDGISKRVDCNFWYTTSTLDDLNATSISGAKFSTVKNRTYTGKAITPTPSLSLDGKKLKKGVDYRLVYSSNKNVGTAKIKAKGIGNYKGTKTLTFKILPKKVSSFKRKAGTKQITLSWAKVSSATGYQIYRKDTYNSKTYKKIKTISKNTVTTWTNTKLKANREYFYCIRSYKKVNGKNYYSDYTYLTAPTLPGTKKTILTKKVKLYDNPTIEGKAVVTIRKNTTITYLGRTYTKGKSNALHIKCTVNKKTYRGYISSETSLNL